MLFLIALSGGFNSLGLSCSTSCLLCFAVRGAFKTLSGKVELLTTLAGIGLDVILVTVLTISLLKAISVTASSGSMNINFSKCIFAERLRFIMMIRFFSDEKLNWLAKRYCGMPTTFNK